MRRSYLAILALFTVAACQDRPTTLAPEGPDEPSLSAAPDDAEDRWIVVFQDGVADPPGLARQLASAHGGQLRFTYRHAIKGFAAELPATAVQALRNNPNVAYVEPDADVRLFGTQTNPPSWGLDRVDQRDLPLDDSYTFANDGSGASVYVLDTGVNISHNDFGGRAQYMPNGSNGDFVGDGHGSAEDCHGHGTHVAGTAAGNSFGIAKGAAIWAGRVVNCAGSGQVSMAIAGVDWITANGQQPASVNMSLGYGDVQSLRDAVEASIAAGFNYAVAAGNGNFVGIPQDACNESPAGAPNANTIGATEIDDDEASFSNYGTCVDLLAPGVSITSAWIGGDNATATISGTSMATPHVAGAIALYLTENPSATPAQVSAALVNNATTGRINHHSRSSRNGTPNRLLYTAFIGGSTNDPPSVSITSPADGSSFDEGTSITFTGTASDTEDGDISSSIAWSSDLDGSLGVGSSITTTLSVGTHTVTASVTDSGGAPGSDQITVTVNPVGGGGLTLTATGYKTRGLQKADLEWTGAGSTDVDVYRDGALIATTPNDGFYTDNIDQRGSGSYTYQVCEAGTSTCSNTSTVTF